MDKRALVGVMGVLAGCGYTIEPGHRGLLFNGHRGGLSHEVLMPGYRWVGAYGRIDDFDVTYSTKRESLHTTSAEGLALDLKLAVIYRPIVEELYQLDTEIGPNYYDEVIGREFLSAARGVFARHSYTELVAKNEKIEDEIEEDLRRRTHGKHVEISSVTMEQIDYAPEISEAIRAKLVSEQESARKKVAIEQEALRNQLQLENEAKRKAAELQHEAERRRLEIEQQREQVRLKAEAELAAKQNEKAITLEQAQIDLARAQAEAKIDLIKAQSTAKQREVLAKAQAAEKRAETETLTPLAVMMHAYDALAKLGGEGTTVMLGDFANAPRFLFPGSLGGLNPFAAPSGKPVAHRHAPAEGEAGGR